MRTGPVWKQDEVAPGNILAEMIGEQPIIEEVRYAVDPRRPRYVFNPFRNRKLHGRYPALYNIQPVPGLGCFIPERVILPLTIGQSPDVDYNSMRTDSLEASERYIPPAQRSAAGSEMRDFERLPVHNATSMVAEYGSQYDMPTGFCQITELDGVDDFSIALRITRLCFPEARIRPAPEPPVTIDQDLAHLDNLINGGADDLPIVMRLFRAMNENKAWAEEHYRRLIAQLDEHSGNPMLGKGKADRLDVAVCGWLGVPVPRSVSKTDQGGQQKIQVEMVGAAAQETRAQIQCAECGTLVNLLPDGNPPKFCFGCRTPFVEEAKVEEKAKSAGKKPK